METGRKKRTVNEQLIYTCVFGKLNRLEEGCIFDKDWVFEFGARETSDCYCFAIAVKHTGDPDDRVSTSTESEVFIAIADIENVDLVQAKLDGLMSEFSPKPEIIVLIRADRPQVDKWTLVSGIYRHTTQDHGEIEIDPLLGDFCIYIEDVYADVDGIYEQVAA